MEVNSNKETKLQRPVSPFVRGVLVVSGIIVTFIGVAGVFIPLLPTTPFLLLASWCFTRSSEKLNQKLMTNRILGPYILNYREKKGITKRHKVFTLLFLWATLAFSFYMSPDWWWLWLMLAFIGIGVSFHIISFKTLKE